MSPCFYFLHCVHNFASRTLNLLQTFNVFQLPARGSQVIPRLADLSHFLPDDIHQFFSPHLMINYPAFLGGFAFSSQDLFSLAVLTTYCSNSSTQRGKHSLLHMVSEDICVQLSYVGLAHKDAAKLPAAVGSTFEITTGVSVTRKLSPHELLLKHPHDKHLHFPEMDGGRRERGYQG